MKIVVLTNMSPIAITFERVTRAWINKDLGKVNIEYKNRQALYDLPGKVFSIEVFCPVGKFPTFDGSHELDLIGPGDIVYIHEE